MHRFWMFLLFFIFACPLRADATAEFNTIPDRALKTLVNIDGGVKICSFMDKQADKDLIPKMNLEKISLAVEPMLPVDMKYLAGKLYTGSSGMKFVPNASRIVQIGGPFVDFLQEISFMQPRLICLGGFFSDNVFQVTEIIFQPE